MILSKDRISNNTAIALRKYGYTCEFISKNFAPHRPQTPFWVITKSDTSIDNIVEYSRKQILNSLSSTS
jgi:hypothetical protein